MHRGLLIAGALVVTPASAPVAAEPSHVARLDPIEAEVEREPLVLDSDDAGSDVPVAPSGRPTAAFEVRLGTGATLPVVPRPLASTIDEAGHDAISPVIPRIDAYLGGVFGPVTIGLDMGGSIDAGPTDDHRLTTGRVFLTAGYRVPIAHDLGITPNVGVGYMSQRLCFQRPGNQASAPGDTAFRQLVQSPGPDTCLVSQGPALRLGVALDYDILFRETDGTIGGFRFRLEPGVEVPLQGNTWSGGHPALTSFEGPSGPPLNAFVSFSVGVLIGR